ncbi:DivIVA domain-containing protein [Actinophytocola glycyrrhizae]|uniref:Cell wall synthesis protein Wag31 n=1 Tax=Actinophytocola glycyrrhizae TaxID=2044873 RepID=A0ABV9RZF4_9PSEU
MDVPLTPIVVDVVTFDRAPLGRRGYHEDQVDDFLDRVQATLAGEDDLTATQVREVEFDPAPFIRRGYHEDQVDEFLDLVVEELDRRAAGAQGASPGGVPPGLPGPANAVPGRPDAGAPSAASSPGAHTPNPAPANGHPGPVGGPGNGVPHAGGLPIAGGAFASGAPVAWVPFPGHQPRPVPPPTPAEQTNPMLFTQPPSLPSPSTQPLKRALGAASGPPESSVAAGTDKTGVPAEAEPDESAGRSQSVAAGQAASAFRAGAMPELGAPTDAARAVPAQEPDTARPVPEDTARNPVPEDEPDAPGQPAPQPEATGRTLADYAPKPAPTFPLPPAPQGEPGYAPSDVAALLKLLATSPDREQLLAFTLTRTDNGGFHAGTVDALRQAWLDALPTKRP